MLTLIIVRTIVGLVGHAVPWTLEIHVLSGCAIKKQQQWRHIVLYLELASDESSITPDPNELV